MNRSGLLRCAAAAPALAILSACAGLATTPSSGAPTVRYAGPVAFVDGRPVTAARPYLSEVSDYVPILPDRSAKSNAKNFEYIMNYYGTYAGIFDYPKSTKQIGTIKNVGGQGCTNVLYGYGKRTFWIVAGPDAITNYEIPQKPLRTLSLPASSKPSSCAMDTSGDLAVGILYGSNQGDIVFFKHARGKGTWIGTPLAREYFDGYDDKGNLFFDGFSATSDFGLMEIPKGSTKVETITTSNFIKYPGSVQWDGQYLVVTDQNANAMYRYSISGTQATLKGTVLLSGSSDCAQTWIATGVVYCADAGLTSAEVFKYPAGGSYIAKFRGKFDLPLGAVAVTK